MNTLGLYIHIPFCLRKCYYCDFVSYPDRECDFGRYIDAIIKEAELYKDYINERRIDTVFIGGGTPSLLPCKQITTLASGLKAITDFAAGEFTIEANPETITEEKVLAYKAAGINRMSIGLQSHDNAVLKEIGRRHTYEDFLRVYEIVAAHIRNINVDIMFGLPEQTVQNLSETVKRIIELNPTHISSYALKLEQGTPLYGKYKGTNDETDREMYHTAVETLTEAGYIHYETSNFSKPGFECAHNLKYWKGQEYLGLGVAASSFNGASRWTNATELDEYISNVGNGIKPADEMIFLSAADKKQEYIMLRLRLSEGINIIDYQNTFGTAFMAEHDSSVLWALNSGLVTVSNEFIKPTLKGFDLQNTLISEFMKNV